jgi:hypothetical protein
MGRFRDIADLLLRRQIWGPFLISVGAYLLFALRFGESDQSFFTTFVKVGISIALVLAGIVMMFYQLRSDELVVSSTTSDDLTSSPEYTVVQLSKNYEIRRRQTTQGFVLSGVFMALGFLVILSGSAGSLFGFTREGSNLTTVAGVLMEFISGTSLLVYRINFRRLNETTDRLDGAWRVLTAHKLVEGLGEGKREEATMKLIDALLKPTAPGREEPPNAGC